MDNPKKLATLGTHDTDERLEKTEGAIKNGQSKETSNIGYTWHKTKTNQTKNITHVVHHYTETNTNNVIRHEPPYKQLEVKTNQTNTTNVKKTWALLQTTGGKDEPNIVFMRKSQRTSQHVTNNLKTHSSFQFIFVIMNFRNCG
jgi:hypothetical protein